MNVSNTVLAIIITNKMRKISKKLKLFIFNTKHMSTNSKSHIIKVKPLNVLPAFLKEALIGIMLSDGHLGKQYKNARLTITFAERYFLLANYIYALFCKYSTPRGFQKRKVKSGITS